MQIGPNLARQSELRGMKERAPAFQFFPRQFAGDDQVMGMDLEASGYENIVLRGVFLGLHVSEVRRMMP